jgi:hypothetical protein
VSRAIRESGLRTRLLLLKLYLDPNDLISQTLLGFVVGNLPQSLKDPYAPMFLVDDPTP